MDLVINYQNFYEQRIMDLGTLKYVFRSIESNANMFDKVFFIYDGDNTMLPNWLNTENLVMLKHSDFIPSEFLPTYNQHVIEMFIHLISGLSEHFVYLKENTIFFEKINENELVENGKIFINYSDKHEYEDRKLFLQEKASSELTYYITYNRGEQDVFPEGFCIVPEKGANIMQKTLNESVYNETKGILNNHNKIIESQDSIPYDIFLTALVRSGLAENGIKRAYIPLHLYKNEGLDDAIMNSGGKIIYFDNSLINNEEQFEYASKTIDDIMKARFPKKSKFEI